MGARRMGRELALQWLFATDMSETDPRELIKYFGEAPDFEWALANNSEEDWELSKNFAKQLLEGVMEHRKEIDEMIQSHSAHWKIHRMAVVDRNVLRMGVYEIKYLDEIPPKVTLNEAIEIAKKYGSEDSAPFVNGVLDGILRD